MFITKKHLSRRTLLRGAGTAIALPLLDSMIPASVALAQTAANPLPRVGAIYIPHGATMAQWTPTKTGKDFEFTPIPKSLEPYRHQLNVISGLANTPVGPEEGEDSGGAQNHERAAAAFLTCAHPIKGDRAMVGQSFDQAKHEGARPQARHHEHRQQAVDHFGRHVHQQADEAERPDAARDAGQGAARGGVVRCHRGAVRHCSRTG